MPPTPSLSAWFLRLRPLAIAALIALWLAGMVWLHVSRPAPGTRAGADQLANLVQAVRVPPGMRPLGPAIGVERGELRATRRFDAPAWTADRAVDAFRAQLLAEGWTARDRADDASPCGRSVRFTRGEVTLYVSAKTCAPRLHVQLSANTSTRWTGIAPK